ncbi:MAG: CocE/NonD family hydrolase, partial [Pseudomonadota bacterium]
MKRLLQQIIFLLSAISILALCAAQAFSSPFLNDTEREIRQRLELLGLTDYVLELNVKVPVPGAVAQEQVNLWATLIRPDPDKKKPTILVATPYRRENTLPLVESLLTHDYNLMILDVRGTGSSEGSWLSFGLAEQYDVAHVIDAWIPAQDWSDGRVGMIGPSYCAIIQLLAAGRVQTDNESGQPLHLKAIMPIEAMSDTYLDIVMQGGNLNLGFIPVWLDGINQMSLDPPLLLEEAGFPPDPDILREAAEILEAHQANIAVAEGWIMNYDHAADGLFYDIRSSMIYWPEKPSAGWGFAQGDDVISSKLPVFLTSGWFDLFLRGTLNYYAFGLAQHDILDKAMIIGPWYHADGAVLRGIKGFATGDLQARWFDWKIKGVDDPFMAAFPVLLYVLGEERWRAEKSWPLPEGRLQQSTLHLSRRFASMIPQDWFSTLNRKNNF